MHIKYTDRNIFLPPRTDFSCISSNGRWFKSSWRHTHFILNFLLSSRSSQLGEAPTNELIQSNIETKIIRLNIPV